MRPPPGAPLKPVIKLTVPPRCLDSPFRRCTELITMGDGLHLINNLQLTSFLPTLFIPPYRFSNLDVTCCNVVAEPTHILMKGYAKERK